MVTPYSVSLIVYPCPPSLFWESDFAQMSPVGMSEDTGKAFRPSKLCTHRDKTHRQREVKKLGKQATVKQLGRH